MKQVEFYHGWTIIKNKKALAFLFQMCLMAVKEDDVDCLVSHFEQLRDIVPDSLPEL
jgi:hypothetical protein